MKQSKPFCSGRKAIHCLVPLIPILLFVLAIAVATPSLLTCDESSTREFEVSSWKNSFPNENCDDPSKTAPLIRLGTINSRWYEILLTQVLKTYYYIPQGFMIYAVPSDYVTRYTDTKKFFCSGKPDFVDVDQLYLLQGSIMTFNVCVCSNNTVRPGWVNFSIYDDVESYYNTSTVNTIDFHQIRVNASQTHCPMYTYTAPHDGFYYVMSGNSKQTMYANVVSFSAEVDMKYVNLTDLWNGSYSTGECFQTDEEPCSVAIHSDWFRNYDIFVSVTSPPHKYQLGLVRWQLSFRTLWYSGPAVAGGIVAVPIFLIAVGVSCCVYRRKPRRRRYKKLSIQ